MPTILPERTIDSLFAFEVLAALPTAKVYSPANNAGPGTPDHVVTVSSGSIVFELKTLSSATATGAPWYVDVPRAQLSSYVGTAANVTYVLPAEPANRLMPWLRACTTDPDSRGRCQACYASSTAGDAASRRRWSGMLPRWQSEPPEVQLQPWFNHWAWCLPASMLDAHLRAKGTTSGTARSWHVSAQDAALGSLPGAVRLCHLLQGLTALSAPTPPGPGGVDGDSGDGPSPETDLPDFGDGRVENAEGNNSPSDGTSRIDLEVFQCPEDTELIQAEESHLVVVSA